MIKRRGNKTKKRSNEIEKRRKRLRIGAIRRRSNKVATAQMNITQPTKVHVTSLTFCSQEF